jgi:uncharacterized membrane protein YdjX (TVP38/TMEM64 family)
MWQDLLARVRRKGVALLPVLAGAGVLSVLLVVVGMVVRPWLPEAAELWLAQLDAADPVAATASLRSAMAGLGLPVEAGFLLVQIMQVLLAPIPGQLMGVMGGMLFGFWHGILLTMTGLTIGSWLAMGLSRWAGEHLVRRFVPPAVMVGFDGVVQRSRLVDFLVIFLLPVLPDDAICFMAGLTRLRLRDLLLVCLVGRFPGMAVLTFAGSQLDTDTGLATSVFAAAMTIAVVVWLYDDRVVAWVNGRRNGDRT